MKIPDTTHDATNWLFTIGISVTVKDMKSVKRRAPFFNLQKKDINILNPFNFCIYCFENGNIFKKQEMKKKKFLAQIKSLFKRKVFLH